MNEDMPWVNLTQEEVDELRRSKQQLSQYAQEKIRKLMSNYIPDDDTIEELIGEELTDEKKKELDEMRSENKVPREEVMRIATKFIGEYSDQLKELAAIERKELMEELEALKKENFQKVADCCMEEYTKNYGEMPEDEYWVYMVADYFGTGEGTTTCLMVTQASPYGDDFPSEGPDKYTPVNSQAYRAVRKFHEQFGTWMLHGLKFLPKNEFYTQCAYFIPPAMMKLANAKCFKEFYTEVHYNFS